MSNMLGGKQGTAYLGTNANQPANVVFNPKRAPTQYDTDNVSVADIWMDMSNANPYDRIWTLASLAGSTTSKGPLAYWVKQVAADSAGAVNIYGNLKLPNTTSSSVGVITFGGLSFIHNYGLNNTFVGSLSGNQDPALTGGGCTGCGNATLSALTTGTNNSTFGESSGTAITTGEYNTLVGSNSGSTYTTESNNIVIGETAGTAADAAFIRIGNDTTPITKTFIQGIRGVTTDVVDAIAVLIDSAGQLGTVSSSIRYKENVQDMGDASSPLMDLRPVTFNYKKDESKKRDYGLIAEEVEPVFPDLVVYNQDGEVETVKYHVLSSLLLNELQKQNKKIQNLEERLRSLEKAYL